MTMAAADMESNANTAYMGSNAHTLGVRGGCAKKGQCEKRCDKCFHQTLQG